MQQVRQLERAMRRLQQHEFVPAAVLCTCGKAVPLSEFHAFDAVQVIANCEACTNVVRLPAD